ncbi:GTPase Era [Candidatus Gottesmanbacteria bacterium RIFCSPLOWO2_01_FULL_46_21]|uniref:GTPase Era n=2 Tax=Microgenomates group TaxID=1794810 RepID=A0A1F6AV30_9BACT|nr:MAG: GTPase Era [Candidatus Curtissbacteria bacterium GW2011_GWA1_41_11]OGG28551.1 MAG: GTPase Era [Candidatus Gottesmanbacteria bacterium RIFCSPLOWO2_01_FULL_46_21]
MKSGIVCLVGRPNVGKSTLLNNILGQKVAITSPKPQTTRVNLEAIYEDDRGQIVFVDTPGIFGKVVDSLSKRINPRAEQALSRHVDVVIYMVDHTREKDFEENKAIGIVRKIKAPKILVINKSDVRTPTYIVQYKFLEEEFDRTIEISALHRKNLNTLLEAIFELLPEGKPMVDTKDMVQPGLNIESKTFLAEIIREKAFLFLRREVPYRVTAIVDEVVERGSGALYIKARILTTEDRYKAMIIGAGGVMIKEISMASRKELETATSKKVFLDLTVETNEHWMDFV